MSGLRAVSFETAPTKQCFENAIHACFSAKEESSSSEQTVFKQDKYLLNAFETVSNIGTFRAVGSILGCIPITVSETGVSRDRSYVTSIYSHYVAYAKDEISLHVRNSVLRMVAFITIGAIDLLIGVSRADEACLFVNSLLVSTCLYPELELCEQDVRVIHSDIRVEFPNSPIVWRSLDEVATPELLRSLTKAKCRLLFSRVVNHWEWDVAHKNSKSSVWRRSAMMSDLLVFERVTGLQRSDIRLVQRGQLSARALLAAGRRDPGGAIGPTHYLQMLEPKHVAEDPTLGTRLASLYEKLYLIKYSARNPAYTGEFFHRMILHRLWDVCVARRLSDDTVDGFMALYDVGNGFCTAPAVGYDSRREDSLYVVLQYWTFLEAKSRNMRLNMSGGVANYKQSRGAKPVIEYVAVQVEHLSWRQQLFWIVASYLTTCVIVPIIQRRLQRKEFL